MYHDYKCQVLPTDKHLITCTGNDWLSFSRSYLRLLNQYMPGRCFYLRYGSLESYREWSEVFLIRMEIMAPSGADKR